MNNRRSFDSITGLKGLFIMVIVFLHTLPDTPLVNSIPFTSFLKNYGAIFGNSMFFMISGFLMGCSYRERIHNGEVSFQDFFVRRLKKLYPMYFASNLVMLVLQILIYDVSVIDLEKIVFTVLLQHGGGIGDGAPYNGSTWFISALFVCYIVFFYISYAARHNTQYYFMVAACVVLGYYRMSGILQIPFPEGISFVNFFLGCAIAEIYPVIHRKLGKKLWIGSGALLLVSGYLMLDYGVEIICGDSRTAFVFWFCPLILLLALETNPVSAILGSKPMGALGKISVSVYYWHMVVYFAFEYVCNKMAPGHGIRDTEFVIYLAVMFAVCILIEWAWNHRTKTTPRPIP